MSNEMHIVNDVGENDIELDISVVTTVDKDEWIEASKDIYGIEHREATIDIFRNRDLNNLGFSFILVKHNDRIIARAIINYQDDIDIIMGFIVDYEYRGIGIGKILMEFIKTKYSNLVLTFSSVNPVMWELGISLGFTKVSEQIDKVIFKPSKKFLYIKEMG